MNRWVENRDRWVEVIAVKGREVRHRKNPRRKRKKKERAGVDVRPTGKIVQTNRLESLECPISFHRRQHGSILSRQGLSHDVSHSPVNHQLLIKPAASLSKPECSHSCTECVCEVGWKASRWGSGQRGVVRSAKLGGSFLLTSAASQQ